MAIKTWTQLSGNELVAHAEVENAVSNGELAWSGSNPGLAPGYCYTRDDFETYIEHSSMSSSGIALNECMSKSEMEAYRILAPAFTALSEDSEWVMLEVSWQGRLVFGVNALTASVKVERSINGGAFTTVTTMGVTPGSSGNVTPWVQVDAGQTLEIRVTPYTGAGGTGTAGSAVAREVPEPA